MSFGGFGSEGYDFESRPEVDEWLRRRAQASPPPAPTRFEVLDGEQVALAPLTEAQAACSIRLNRLLGEAVGDLATVSVHNPVDLGGGSQPCPDVAVLRRRPDDYRDGFAGVDDILLLVEVVDSSFGLTHARGRKASLYARCGIAECWIVDLMSQQLLVHRQPASGGYRDLRHLRSGSVIISVALPGVTLPVGKILGEADL
ncbi:MAG: Uma2 family endonuclease [Acidobacteriota bacterium]|nr:Uma2 family endonuclease [Acidobacteriota bacterium]